MKPTLSRQRQRGVALMAMLAVLILGATWWTVSAVSNPTNRTAEQRAQNAQILQQAKTAVMGWVAQQATIAAEADPGRLPCPEPAANIGTADQGMATPNCALPAVGRLPWRTLGLDQLRDAAGEPLWYVVSPGWSKPDAITNTVINSNSTGALTLDATADVVALIIAPGAPISVAASANCLARNQLRSSIDPRDYFECQNAVAGADAFASNGPTGSFNDQVLAVTAAELLPLIEAAVATRFERGIAPAIRSAYSNSDPANPNLAWPSINAVLPFAAQFGPPATANFEGDDGRFRGLLPFVRSYKACSCAPAGNCECTPTACTAAPDCDPDFVRWQAPDPTMTGSDVYSSSCTRVNGNTEIACTFYVRVPLLGAPPSSVAFTLSGMTARRVGRSLRQFQPEAPMPGVRASGRGLSGTLNANSTATLALTAEADTADLASAPLVDNALCGIAGPPSLTTGCKQDSITVPRTVLVDHALLDKDHATYGWFHRNFWHHVSYYAIAEPIAPDGSGACVSPPVGANTDCLSVDYLPSSGKQRGLIVISGRSLSTPPAARPNGTLSDWLEGQNADFSGGSNARIYTLRDPALRINRTFNDRIAIIGENP